MNTFTAPEMNQITRALWQQVQMENKLHGKGNANSERIMAVIKKVESMKEEG